MAEVIGFKIELPGSEKLTVVLKEQRQLKEEIAATRKQLKQKGLGAEEYERLDRKLFELTNTQKQLRKETTQTRNEFIASGKTGTGAYDRLSSSLRVVRKQSKDAQASVVILTNELNQLEKEGKQNTEQFARLSKELVDAKSAVLQLTPAVDKLDKELKQIDATNGQFQRNVGNYPKLFQGVAGSLQNLGISLPDVSKGALLASGAVAGVALVGEGLRQTAQYVRDITVEFGNLRKEASLATGETGDELDKLTKKTQAISKTFGKDFDEVIKKSNSAAQIFEEDVDNVLEVVKKANLARAGEGFLEDLEEFAPQAKEAKLELEEFAAVLVQSERLGIKDNFGADAYKEAVLRLRELPPATQEALEAIGLSSKEIRKQIEEEGIGAAIKTVGGQLDKFEDDSKEAGVAVANIFGAKGEDIGASQIAALAQADLNLNNLIDTSNKYTQQQQRQLQIEERLAEAQLKLANSFGDANINLSQLSDELKTEFTLLLVDVIEASKELLELFLPLASVIKNLGIEFGETGEKVNVLSFLLKTVLFGQLRVITKSVRVVSAFFNEFKDTLFRAGDAIRNFSLSGITEEFSGFFKRVGVRADIINKETEKSSNLAQKVNGLIKARVELLRQQSRVTPEEPGGNFERLKKRSEELKKEIKDLSLAGKDYSKQLKELRRIQGQLSKAEELTNPLDDKEVQAAKGSIEDLEKVVSDLQTELRQSADPEFLQKTNEELETAQVNLQKAKDLLDRIQGNSQGVEPIKAPVELDIDLSTLEEEIVSQKVIKLPLSAETQDIKSQFAAIETERREAILDSATTTAEQVNEINREAELKRLQAQLDLLNLEKEERIRIEEEIAAVREQQRIAEREKTLSEINFTLESVQQGIDVISQLFDARLEKDLNTLEKRREKELEGVAEGSQEEENINKKFDKKKEQLEKKAFERNKKLSIAQAVINGALAITRILADVPKFDFGVSTAILTGLAVATTAAQIAAISAQEFATGGVVRGANIPTKPNGDNVLATLKTGEVVLNKGQQQNLSNVTGWRSSDIFNTIGVPGFASGGVNGTPSNLAPNGLIEQQVRQTTVVVNIDSEMIGKEIADTIKTELEGLGDLGDFASDLVESNEALNDSIDELVTLQQQEIESK